jgi:conjugal transfer pilin signal peptidase TrbI
MTFDKRNINNFCNAIMFGVIAVIFITCCSLALDYKSMKLGFNGTDSLDGYIALTDLGAKPKIGDTVLFEPPENQFTSKGVPFMKIIIGVEGDSVMVKDGGLFVAGKFRGTVKKYSKNGVELFPIENQIIPTNMFFMWTPHQDSYDSRYQSIGLINEDSIFGVSKFIF